MSTLTHVGVVMVFVGAILIVIAEPKLPVILAEAAICVIVVLIALQTRRRDE